MFTSQLLFTFDSAIRSLLSSILNLNFSDNLVWSQATLPIKSGGLGVRSVAQLALSAFFASAVGCRRLISILLAPLSSLDPFWDLALEYWQKLTDLPLPLKTFLTYKRLGIFLPLQLTTSFDSSYSSSPSHLARLLSVSSRESGAWLHVLPIASVGLKLEDDVVRVGVGLRLGIPFGAPTHLYWLSVIG